MRKVVESLLNAAKIATMKEVGIGRVESASIWRALYPFVVCLVAIIEAIRQKEIDDLTLTWGSNAWLIEGILLRTCEICEENPGKREDSTFHHAQQ